METYFLMGKEDKKSRLKSKNFSPYNSSTMKDKRVIAVVDLKAFYSFVECLDRGLDPFNTPLVVADKDRGKNTIVLSVTPYLKSKGIPSRLRIKELPKGIDYIYAVPRMERYIEMSTNVMSILLDFVSEEDLHIYSIDEAFMDITSYLNYYKKTPEQLVKYILDTIKDRLGLCATAGIGDNFFLAKVALDIYAKSAPNGIATIKQEDVKDKVWPITPLHKVWGIGHNLEARLNAFGIFTMKDLALSNVEFIKKHFGIIGEQMVNHANGIDDSDIHEIYIPESRSLSIGQALFKDYPCDEGRLIIKEMCDDVTMRMRNDNLTAGSISLFIGYSKSGGFARESKLFVQTNSTKAIIKSVLDLYDKYIDKKQTIRRISICLGMLKTNDDSEQLTLFENHIENEKNHSIDKALDFIKKIFGDNSVLRLSSLLPYSTAIERHMQIGGHKR